VLGSAVAVGSPTPGLLTVPVVALAAGLAIVKYRLYDIDLVINKTLVVGSMAALVTAGYVAVVVGVGQLVGLDAGPSPVLPLVATAMVAVAFEPFRRRVQTWADHLVYGNRPTPYEALARLPSQLSRGGQDDDLFGSGLGTSSCRWGRGGRRLARTPGRPTPSASPLWLPQVRARSGRSNTRGRCGGR